MNQPITNLGSPLVIGVLLVCVFALGSRAAEKLVENGGFDDAKEPLKGWMTDYQWTGNKHYVGNKDRVSVIPSKDGRSTVARISPAGDAGAKMECIPISFEAGYRYTCELDVKGGPYRIYFAGYKWKPGVRPSKEPKPGELRLIYKSKASSGSASSWKKEKLELPGIKLSSTAKKHLKEVRFVTVYVWMMKEGYVDSITVKRTKDSSVKF